MECWNIAFNKNGSSIATGTQSGNINIFNIKADNENNYNTTTTTTNNNNDNNSNSDKYTLETHGKFTLSVAYVILRIF